MPVVLLGLVIIFCVGILGDFLLRLEGLETTSNQQSVEEIVQAIPKRAYTYFECDSANFRRGNFSCRDSRVFEPATKIGILVSSILFALVHTPTDIGSFVIYWGMGLALSSVCVAAQVTLKLLSLTHLLFGML